jgi:hypothetical protein
MTGSHANVPQKIGSPLQVAKPVSRHPILEFDCGRWLSASWTTVQGTTSAGIARLRLWNGWLCQAQATRTVTMVDHRLNRPGRRSVCSHQRINGTVPEVREERRQLRSPSGEKAQGWGQIGGVDQLRPRQPHSQVIRQAKSKHPRSRPRIQEGRRTSSPRALQKPSPGISSSQVPSKS